MANSLLAVKTYGEWFYGFEALYATTMWMAFEAVKIIKGPDKFAGLGICGIIANLGFVVTFMAAGLPGGRLAKVTSVTAAVSAFASSYFHFAIDSKMELGARWGLWFTSGILLVLGSFMSQPTSAAPAVRGPDLMLTLRTIYVIGLVTCIPAILNVRLSGARPDLVRTAAEVSFVMVLLGLLLRGASWSLAPGQSDRLVSLAWYWSVSLVIAWFCIAAAHLSGFRLIGTVDVIVLALGFVAGCVYAAWAFTRNPLTSASVPVTLGSSARPAPRAGPFARGARR